MFRSPLLTRIAIAAVVIAVGLAMAKTLANHGGPMLAAAESLGFASFALAVVLTIAHRLLNAGGWGIVLSSLGEPVQAVPAARIWLASEACRWLPGSLWSFGSRWMLAANRGVSGVVASTSVVLELGVTVAAWGVVALAGSWWLRLPAAIEQMFSSQVLGVIALGVAVGFWVVTRSPLAARLSAKLADIRKITQIRPDVRQLAVAFGFFIAMAAFNGVILHTMVSAMPSGGNCPWPGVMAANAAAWLIGFFAIFAPGGLVVREACLAGMLSAWMPVEEAFAVALAWRLVQIIAEIVGFVGISAVGLPDTLREGPTPAGVLIG